MGQCDECEKVSDNTGWWSIERETDNGLEWFSLCSDVCLKKWIELVGK